MKRLFTLALLVAIAAMAWAQVPAVDKAGGKNGFTFLQVTDPQIGFHKKGQTLQWTIDNFETMVQRINELKPSFVIITGDLIHRHFKPEQMEAYRRVVAKVSNDIPVFQIPGNHDMPKYADEPRLLYLDAFGYDKFSFEYGDFGFIGINTNSLVCDTLPARADAVAQLQWLHGELERYKSKKGVFVFAHHPPVLAPGSPVKHKSEWDEPYRTQYISLMKQYNVKAIFDGHTHYGETTEIDGIPVFTTRASSLPLYGDTSGFLSITVAPDGTWTTKQLPLQ